MDRDFYFLGAKLKSKIEQYLKQSTPQNTSSDHLIDEPKIEYFSSKNDDILLQFDQISIQKQSLEREIELLKKKYDKSRNECVKSRADVEMLKSKLLEMSNDLDMVKNERDQLGRDAETFESYVDTLHSDHASLKGIVQKIQDAFKVTKEELSKVTACYQDSLRSLKVCNEVIVKEQLSAKQLRDEVHDLQSRIDQEYAERTELLMNRDSMIQTIAALQQQIKKLETTLSSERKIYLVDSRIKTAIAGLSDASDKWVAVADRVVDKVSTMQSEVTGKYDEMLSRKDAEIESVMELLHTREAKHTQELGDLLVRISTPDHLGKSGVESQAPSSAPTGFRPRIEGEDSTAVAAQDCFGEIDGSLCSEQTDSRHARKRPAEVMNSSSSLNLTDMNYGLSVSSAQSSAGSAVPGNYAQAPRQMTTSTTKKPENVRTQGAAGASSEMSSNLSASVSSPGCATCVCGEQPYGLMKVCSGCRKEFHSACARKIRSQQPEGVSGGAFRCSKCIH